MMTSTNLAKVGRDRWARRESADGRPSGAKCHCLRGPALPVQFYFVSFVYFVVTNSSRS